MKKTILAIFTFSLLSLLGFAADRHVGPGETYSTIQSAVDASSSGDVIYVHEGTYREQVEIGIEGITIQAYGTDKVIVSGTEVITSWTDEGNGVYSAAVNWDITDVSKSNQVFLDGKMIHLVRYPKLSQNEEWILDWEENNIDSDVTEIGSTGEAPLNNEIQFMDNDFEGGADLWTGSKIWVNLCNPTERKDGQGSTGEVISINGKTFNVKGKGWRPVGNGGNWNIVKDSRFYLFDPLPSKVHANGGPSNLLGNGEWWKDGNTLYVKTWDGNAPSSTGTGNNVIEVKKRLWGFKPTEQAQVLKNVTIKGVQLFGTSITTETLFEGRTSLSEAENNVIDGINGTYIDHLVDLTGDWQSQWDGRSGIILSGTNNRLMNSNFKYTAASAVSVVGMGNKVYNCVFDSCNYQVTESCPINFGIANSVTYDHDIGYNTIKNTPHGAIKIKQIKNYVVRRKGLARVHHNEIHNCLRRAHDSGALDGAGDYQWTRVDHNRIYDVTGWLRIGIYLDYGDWDVNSMGRMIMDHNLSYNTNRPTQFNHCRGIWSFNNTFQSTYEPGTPGMVAAFMPEMESYSINNMSGGRYGDRYNSHYRNISWDRTLVDPTTPAWDFHIDENGDKADRNIDQGTSVEPFNDPYLNGSNYDIGCYELNEDWDVGANPDYKKVEDVQFSVKEGRYENVNLTLSTPTSGATIRYTTNGKVPTLTYGEVFTGSFELPSSAEVMAIAYKEGMIESFVTIKNYIVTGSRPAESPSDIAPGLDYVAKETIMPELMDFEFLPSVVPRDDQGVASNFNIDEVAITDSVAINYNGYIDIKDEGEYTFYMKSDDGAQLWIGNTLLIDNISANDPQDGNKGLSKEELEGKIKLQAGLHKITVEYYEMEFWKGNPQLVQDDDDALLSLKYSGPGISTKRTIPEVRLFRFDDSGDDFDPEASFIEPMNGAYIEAGKAAEFNVEAWDKGGIEKVEFYVDGELKSTDESAPYEYTSTFNAGNHNIKAKAYDNTGNTHDDEITITAAAYNIIDIEQIQEDIALDGNLTETAWTDAGSIDLTKKVDLIDDANDLSAKLITVYDASGMYFALQVTDNDIQATGFSAGDEVNQNDGVEIFLDIDNSKLGYYDANDYHFAMDINGASYEYAHGNTEGLDYVVDQSLGGYIMEGFIPWTLVGADPMADEKIGLEVKVTDNDAGAYQGKLSLQESGSDDANEYPYLFGIGQFKDNITDNTAPANPVLIGPADNTTTNTQKPSFKWQKIEDPSGILKYEIDINGSVHEVSGTETEYKVLSDLTNGSYNWKVRATDKDDNTGDWSATWSLIVNTSYDDNTGPSAPVLISPADQLSLTSSEPTFTWEEVFDVNGISKYEIQINDRIMDAGYTTTYQASGLTATDSLWRVRAYDNNGNPSTWSEQREFNLSGVTNDAIGKKAYASSIEGSKTSVIGGIDGDLETRWGSQWVVPSWYYVDLGEEKLITRIRIFWESAHATNYKLQVSNDATNWSTFITDSDNPDGLVELVDDFKNIEGVEGRYVRMYATAKSSSYGVSFFEFEIYTGIPPVDNMAPNAPEGILPIGGAAVADVNPVLKWTEVEDIESGIDKYVVDLNGTEYDAGNKGYFNPPHIKEGNYTWKVKAVDGSANESDWSDEYTFTVALNDDIAPDAPTLVFPANNSLKDLESITFEWNKVEDASGIFNYEIEIEGTVYDAGFNTSYSTDIANGTFEWRVRAIDVADNVGAWSNMYSFEVKTLPSYELTIEKTPGGAGVVDLIPSGGTYKHGTKVKLSARFLPGYVSVKWSGDVPVVDTITESIYVVVDSAMTVNAEFLKVVSVASNNLDDANVNIYPNPLGKGALHIDFEGGITDTKADISIIDIAGKQVFAQSKQIQAGSIVMEETGSLQKGIYIIRINLNDKINHHKLIVE